MSTVSLVIVSVSCFLAPRPRKGNLGLGENTGSVPVLTYTCLNPRVSGSGSLPWCVPVQLCYVSVFWCEFVSFYSECVTVYLLCALQDCEPLANPKSCIHLRRVHTALCSGELLVPSCGLPGTGAAPRGSSQLLSHQVSQVSSIQTSNDA